MKIFSPIGNVPFTPTRLQLKKGLLTLHGSMGAWPTSIQFELSDVPAFIRLVRYWLLALVIIVLVILAIIIAIR
jgi:hypothetical protein